MATCNEIPEDVIIEILLMLPVKSLIRARVVCKKWYTIIRNPSFVTNHLNQHTNKSGCLFVNRFDKISEKDVFSLFPDETLAGSPPVYEDVVVDMLFRIEVSLYNGIMCLVKPFHSNRFGLWNPATREFRSLPVLPINSPIRNAFGFGLSPITNDYKVVWIWKTMVQTSYALLPYEVAVYTLSTNSWRFLDVSLPCDFIYNPQSNTCINGVYHWFARDDDDHGLILSFNMGNESFHEIRSIPSSNSKNPILAPYNNSLALICFKSLQIVDIWVMMEERCWTKQFTVQLSLTQHPIGFWKNGQLFMHTGIGGPLALYDPETREIKDLGSCRCSEVMVYRESLVAIGGGDGFLEQDLKFQNFLSGWV